MRCVLESGSSQNSHFGADDSSLNGRNPQLERLEARLDDEESTLKRIDDWQRALACAFRRVLVRRAGSRHF